MRSSQDAITTPSNPGRADWRRVPSWWRTFAAPRAARRWARELLASDGWVVLDTETTGTRKDAEVVQVAVLHPSGATLLEACARAQLPMPADAAAIHGLTDELLAAALPFDVVYAALSRLVSGKRIVAYNAAFDSRLLAQSAARHGLEPLNASWDCAMLAYASFRAEWVEQRASFKWHRLPGAAHGAAADCRATLELIRQMAAPARRPWWKFWTDTMRLTT